MNNYRDPALRANVSLQSLDDTAEATGDFEDADDTVNANRGLSPILHRGRRYSDEEVLAGIANLDMNLNQNQNYDDPGGAAGGGNPNANPGGQGNPFGVIGRPPPFVPAGDGQNAGGAPQIDRRMENLEAAVFHLIRISEANSGTVAEAVARLTEQSGAQLRQMARSSEAVAQNAEALRRERDENRGRVKIDPKLFPTLHITPSNAEATLFAYYAWETGLRHTIASNTHLQQVPYPRLAHGIMASLSGHAAKMAVSIDVNQHADLEVTLTALRNLYCGGAVASKAYALFLSRKMKPAEDLNTYHSTLYNLFIRAFPAAEQRDMEVLCRRFIDGLQPAKLTEHLIMNHEVPHDYNQLLTLVLTIAGRMERASMIGQNNPLAREFTSTATSGHAEPMDVNAIDKRTYTCLICKSRGHFEESCWEVKKARKAHARESQDKQRGGYQNSSRGGRRDDRKTLEKKASSGQRNGSSAKKADESSKKTASDGKKKEIICYRCRAPGHTRPNCPNNNVNSVEIPDHQVSAMHVPEVTFSPNFFN